MHHLPLKALTTSFESWKRTNQVLSNVRFDCIRPYLCIQEETRRYPILRCKTINTKKSYIINKVYKKIILSINTKKIGFYFLRNLIKQWGFYSLIRLKTLLIFSLNMLSQPTSILWKSFVWLKTEQQQFHYLKKSE